MIKILLMKILFLGQKKKDELEVCEIKFLEKDYKYFYNLIKSLPLTNKRFSKYLRGLAHHQEAVYF